MTSEHWQQVKELLHSALQREPAERVAYLEEACRGDASLRKEVEALLASYERAGSFFEIPAMETAARMLAHDHSDSLVGSVAGPYKILARLGAGGMGEVYLAQDTRLDRKIALKLLPSYFTKNEERLRRFQQEASAASRLNHPNILTIFEVGQVDSTQYIATEYIEGQTLRELLTGKRIEIGEALDAAIQIASALSAAHGAGIVHRDIKPENIMLRRDGYVKVLDFGLAKLTENSKERPPSDSRAATQIVVKTDPGMVLGTITYMSPEQARGLEVDAQTDIWSLGVVLYEMVAGRVPFEGNTPSDSIAAILKTEPLPLSHYLTDVPIELERIVTKSLRKERTERYQSVQDMLADLKTLKQEQEIEAKLVGSGRRKSGQSRSSGRVAIETTVDEVPRTAGIEAAHPTSSAEYIVSEIKHHKRAAVIGLAVIVMTVAVAAYSYFALRRETAIDSIAVLPLVNTNADPEIDYLSDGITESLINNLSQLSNMKVIARSSVFRYKGRDTDPQVVGRELGVRAVLTGRVVQRGDGLVVSAELVDVQDNRHLWGEQYNRRLSDVLAVQEEIAREISERLRLKLTGQQQRQLAKRYTDNVEAYQHYLKGRFYWNKRTSGDAEKAIKEFEQAIAKDQNYALAYSGLADTYLLRTSLPPNEAYPKAKEAAIRAIGLDDTLAEAHASLASVRHLYDWDRADTEREFKRAIELNPNYALARGLYGVFAMCMGRFDVAASETRRAQELDPVSPTVHLYASLVYYHAGQYDRSIEEARKAIELDPNVVPAYNFIVNAYAQKKMYEEAIAEGEKARILSKGHAYSKGYANSLGSLGHAYAVAGRVEEANKMLAELRELAVKGYVSPYYSALIYAGLGDKEHALEYLDKLYQDREESLSTLKVDPSFFSLRGEPRFIDLLKKINLAE